MQVQAGAEDTWIVSSVNGRVVATFTIQQSAIEWMNDPKRTEVNYRLFERRTDIREIKLT